MREFEDEIEYPQDGGRECDGAETMEIETRLSEIEARLELAAPGPWRRKVVRIRDSVYHSICGADGDPILRGPDYDLIAHAPVDLTWLIGQVRSLLGRRSGARSVLDLAPPGGDRR